MKIVIAPHALIVTERVNQCANAANIVIGVAHVSHALAEGAGNVWKAYALLVKGAEIAANVTLVITAVIEWKVFAANAKCAKTAVALVNPKTLDRDILNILKFTNLLV